MQIVADQQILRGSAATLATTRYDQDGVAADAVGAVTVGVVSLAGTTIIAAGTATTNPTGTGTYAVALPSSASLDVLQATWTADGASWTTRHEIVGAYYVSVDELRSLANLEDSSKVSNAKLIRARSWFEQLAERHTGRTFVPRYRRPRLDGPGHGRLLVDDQPLRSVRSVRIYSDATTYTALSAGELADVVVGEAWLDRDAGWDAGLQNIVVEYECGYDRPPADLREAAMIAIRSKVLTDNTGRPTISVADGQGGTTRFAVAGEDRPTGIPEVDEVLNALRGPGIA